MANHGGPCRMVRAVQFLWYVVQLTISLALNALVPLWHVPQNLALPDVLHGDSIPVLLHLEYARMAVRALKTLVGMHLAVKHHHVGTMRLEHNGPARQDRECRRDRSSATMKNFRLLSVTSFPALGKGQQHLPLLNPGAGAFPAACCGKASDENIKSSLRIEDSLQLAAGSFNIAAQDNCWITPVFGHGPAASS
jgi:hypothetical protein